MLATLPNALSQANVDAADRLRIRVGRALLRDKPQRDDEDRRPRGARLAAHFAPSVAAGFGIAGFGVTPFGV